MSDPPPRSKPTLVGMPCVLQRLTPSPITPVPGMPPDEAEPFPLTAYADVHVYTPSRSRPIPGGERTAPLPPEANEQRPLGGRDPRLFQNVMLPPPTRNARKADPTVVIRRAQQTEPSFRLKMLAVTLVCYAIAIGVVITLVL